MDYNIEQLGISGESLLEAIDTTTQSMREALNEVLDLHDEDYEYFEQMAMTDEENMSIALVFQDQYDRNKCGSKADDYLSTISRIEQQVEDSTEWVIEHTVDPDQEDDAKQLYLSYIQWRAASRNERDRIL